MPSRPTLTVENASAYRTRDLADLFARGFQDLGCRKDKIVRCLASEDELSEDERNDETTASRGIAYVGSCQSSSTRHGPRGACEGTSMVLLLPAPPALTFRRLTRLFEHEAQHLLGLAHDDMTPEDYWSEGDVPRWARGVVVRTKNGKRLS
jgi:hypothetical protein